MHEITISPSILAYAKDLEGNVEKIGRLLDAGIKNLHIDVMRHPFIKGRNVFSEEEISMICEGLGQDFHLDYHLMISDPLQIIEKISRAIPLPERQKHRITIHREVYRDSRPLSRGGLGKYAGKDYNLASPATGDAVLDQKLKDAHERSGHMMKETIGCVAAAGFRTGLAFEPDTPIDPGYERFMERDVDTVLLMSVRSGYGGQAFMESIYPKLYDTRQSLCEVEVQIDGGINENNIVKLAEAGADNFVVGSYITDNPNPEAAVAALNKLLRRYNTHPKT